MTSPAALRARAEGLAGPLPPLLAEAEHLAQAILMGTHGRRQAGRGDEFWQYRPAHAGDALRMIDWRRSARSDGHFVRQKEWQAAQTVWLWADVGQSMQFSSAKYVETKAHRAAVLAMAMAILLVRGGERVGLLGANGLGAAGGNTQLTRIAYQLNTSTSEVDYDSTSLETIQPHARAVLLSDFLTDQGALIAEMKRAASRGVRGILLQVLDPQEEQFPFGGRTIFQSVGKTLEHETQRARDIRQAYLDRLAARQQELRVAARNTGWHFHSLSTEGSALPALLWAYRAIGPQH